MTSSPQAGVLPGEVLAGKYRVERVLGQGGMGIVVAAHHLQLDEKVALKFLLPEALKNAEAVGRFLREARAAVRIKGEHVARVSDVGRLENGAPYIVMEYLEGLDLSTWIRDRGALPIDQAVDFVLQTCEAIAEAHSLGVVHRDLKPANLFCVERSDGTPSIKVLDFGISKVTTPGATDYDMTRTTALVGSPYYMSPEQLQSSKSVDSRTDIWSLGIILFELLSGRVPFTAEAVTELAIKIAVEASPPLRMFRVEAPPGLESVIMKCLEKDRHQRYQTVGDLAVALADFGSRPARASVERILGTLRRAGISSPVLPPSGQVDGFALTAIAASSVPTVHATATAALPPTSASWSQSSTMTPRNSKVLVAVGALGGLVLLVCAGVGGAVLLGRRAPTVASSQPLTASPPPTAAALATTTLLPPIATVATSASSIASASSAQQPVAPAATHRTPATLTPAAPRPLGKATNPATAPKPNCDPPYYYSATGTRVFKQECL